MMKQKLLSEDCINKLVNILTVGEETEIQAVHQSNMLTESLFLESATGETSVYLVLIPGYRVVIKSALLTHQHCGIFTGLVRVLLSELYTMRTKFPDVEVESVLTPEMASWCKKYKMEPPAGQCPLDDTGIGCSYVTELSKLYFLLTTSV